MEDFSSNKNDFNCDSAKLEDSLPNNKVKKDISPADIGNVLQKLSLREVHSILFLLLDLYDETDLSFRTKCYLEWIEHPKHILLDKVWNLCKGSENSDIFLELLITIQNYKLLKELGACQHHFFERQGTEIRQLWKMLFFICKEIDRDELLCLKGCFTLNNEQAISCEELICHLFTFRHIEENNLTKLAEALVAINRRDLGKIVTNFNPSCQSIQMYYIPEPTSTQPCGECIILNNEFFSCNAQFPPLTTRHGTKNDSDGLSSLWEGYGLHNTVYNNLSAAEIQRLFHTLSQYEFKNCFVLVICLLSHGDKEHIYGSDGVSVCTSSLVKLLAENEYLAGKPKVFIIQACQGDREQKENIRQYTTKMASVYRTDNKASSEDSVDCSLTNIIPEFSDIYIAYSTIPGFVSYRSSSGSIFISELLEQYRNHGHKEDIDQILRIVSRKVGNKGQTPGITSTLNKQLIFKQIDENKIVQN